MKSLSRVRFFATPWTVAYQAPPSMGFSRQEYWSGLPFPFSGDLPYPGIEPGSPTFQADARPESNKIHMHKKYGSSVIYNLFKNNFTSFFLKAVHHSIMVYLHLFEQFSLEKQYFAYIWFFTITNSAAMNNLDQVS